MTTNRLPTAENIEDSSPNPLPSKLRVAGSSPAGTTILPNNSNSLAEHIEFRSSSDPQQNEVRRSDFDDQLTTMGLIKWHQGFLIGLALGLTIAVWCVWLWNLNYRDPAEEIQFGPPHYRILPPSPAGEGVRHG